MFIPNYEREDYLLLQNELLFYFGKPLFKDEMELQNAFDKFKTTPFYNIVMAKFGLEDVDIKGRHWRICRGCGKPFLTMDRRSVSITCYREVYKRYSMKSGKFFGDNYECKMEYNRQVANARNRSLSTEGEVNAEA